jgi:(E)-4-hydroxy-3-methylbut-2-enyl-diphosphate synthase
MILHNSYTVPLSMRVKIGTIELGEGLPVMVQSMANTNTCDVEASKKQLKKIADAGGQLVRFTTQGKKEVEALEKIISSLSPPYDEIPVAADVHFRADVAFEAARVCRKVRINPGNFTERKNRQATTTDAQFEEGRRKNAEQLRILLRICKEHQAALRIGVNHGSLSSRIMSRYGDTPEGMVESAMEFLRVCNEADFHDVVVSLKSSNTVLMVQAVRLLVKTMVEEDLYYPLHLGVTESGDGVEGRIKSAVGMASLLMEGMGDTLRVSLTEPPENEIPVAKKITQLFPKPATLPYDPLSGLP